MVFSNETKGITISTEGTNPKLIVEEVDPDKVGYSKNGNKFIVHDPANEDSTVAYLISQLGIQNPEYPTVMGTLREVRKPTYDEVLTEQESIAKEKKGEGKLEDLLYTSNTWVVS